jgi:ligand-binding sensor domain-containing protein
MQAQQLDVKFKHLTGEQGLSQNHVIHVMQDYEGFIWICTVNGLNKYDGYKITVYKNDPDDSTSISSNNTRYLCEDSDKNLWIATSTGLNLYDRKKDKFTRIKLPSRGGPINFIHSLCTDGKGGLWIGADSQAYLYDFKTNTLKDYFQPTETESPSEKVVWAICRDKQQNIWLGRGSKLYRFDEKNDSFKTFAHEANNDKSLGENSMVSALLSRRNGDLVLGTRGGGLSFSTLRPKHLYTIKMIVTMTKVSPGMLSFHCSKIVRAIYGLELRMPDSTCFILKPERSPGISEIFTTRKVYLIIQFPRFAKMSAGIYG